MTNLHFCLLFSDNLVTKTTDLEAGAAVFRDQTKVVRRRMWWKNAKMNLILGAFENQFVRFMALTHGS